MSRPDDGRPTTLATAEASAGKPAYERHCAPCHGATGEGDGPLASQFDPPPTDLVAPGVRISLKGLELTIQTPHYSTRLMAERVTEGNREMPGWSEVLTPQEIHDVVEYVRSLIATHATRGNGGDGTANVQTGSAP